MWPRPPRSTAATAAPGPHPRQPGLGPSLSPGPHICADGGTGAPKGFRLFVSAGRPPRPVQEEGLRSAGVHAPLSSQLPSPQVTRVPIQRRGQLQCFRMTTGYELAKINSPAREPTPPCDTVPPTRRHHPVGAVAQLGGVHVPPRLHAVPCFLCERPCANKRRCEPRADWRGPPRTPAGHRPQRYLEEL